MKMPILAVVVVCAASSAAWAVDTPLPNGSFETNSATGFNQTITNWQYGFVGTPGGSLPATQAGGLFTVFGKFNQTNVPNGTQFVQIDNLGGGVATLTSGASGVNFAVSDRNIAFRYVYLTNDAPGAGARDTFKVHIDFFASASSTIVTGTIDKTIATSGAFTDTATGFSPYGGGVGVNTAPITYNNTNGVGLNTFALFNIDVSQFFNSFARVSFIIDNGGPSAGTNSNGLGVSGFVLDNVVLNPEPSAVALFALGAAGLGGLAWRRRKTTKPV
jgi:hypothetical protein